MANLGSSIPGRAARLRCGLIVKTGFLASFLVPCGKRGLHDHVPWQLLMAYYCCTLLLCISTHSFCRLWLA